MFVNINMRIYQKCINTARKKQNRFFYERRTDMNDYESLYNSIKDIPVIDTHEHLPSWESSRNQTNDVLSEYLTHYFSCDLVSAGFRDLEKVRGSNYTVKEKWDMLEPYWNDCRYTGYGRALDICANGLYGIDKINRDTVEELNRRFETRRKEGGHYRYVLKEKSKIEISILDNNKNYDPLFFRNVYRADRFLFPDFSQWEGISFDEFLASFETDIAAAVSEGTTVMKTNCAYFRSLYFEKTDRKTAEKLFCQQKSDKALSDFMMHFFLSAAGAKTMTVQIHTGLQEGNGNTLSNSDPILLNNLFGFYPEVRFDLFHIGYPFERKLIALCKNFQNVYIDMCWAHIISPNASVAALCEMIDTVPLNKISGFGGDYCFIDGVYGHSVLAKQNIARALSIKIKEGVFDADTAVLTAEKLLYKNPKEIFGL